jgi:hypothetical protein
MKNSILTELDNSSDRDYWIHCLSSLRDQYKPIGGIDFAKVTGFLLRAKRLQKVELDPEVSPLDTWESIYQDLKKILSKDGQ